ncbi:MAG: sigma 54-interacting transcriptional regulator [Kofleriaceae bacterium]
MTDRPDRSLTMTRDTRDSDPPRTTPTEAALGLLLECDRPLAGSSRHQLGGVSVVSIGRARTERTVKRRTVGGHVTVELGIPDARISTAHARLVLDIDRWVVEDAGSKNGVIINGVQRARAVLDDGDLLELGHTVFLFRGPRAEPAAPSPLDQDSAELAAHAPGLVTLLPTLAHAFDDLAQITRTTTAILLIGETGTGKELVARAVHGLAERAQAFVAVNCGALPTTLVESELFGYVKGAFSGATADRLGLVRTANGGTLFLDEIGDLSPSSQASLLRVLQEREVTPLGSTQPVAVDLHVVAATHHDLAAMVERGSFRRDLYARVAGFTLRMPPLRERREDLGLLIATLLPRIAPDRADRIQIGCDAMRALVEHDWPNNVRELEACLGVALALARGGAIHLEHLPETVRGGSPGEPDLRPRTRLTAADERLLAELKELLETHAGNISAVARASGKARTQIQRWMKRFGLDSDSFRR